MKRKYKYAFTRKEETEGGFTSLIFGAFSLITFLLAAGISFFRAGKAANWVGALGLMAILLSVSGFLIGIRSFREPEKNYGFSVIGSLTNGIFSVGWLALFLMGI